uniref:Peptidase inhibitor 16 n=1 Tax=Magallana gigas TaxID=29159 RepID=K1QAD7_MAGGI
MYSLIQDETIEPVRDLTMCGIKYCLKQHCHIHGLCFLSSQKYFEKAHNIIRRFEYAANMKEMKWDEDLASLAEGWAKACVRGHNQNRETREFKKVVWADSEYLGCAVAFCPKFFRGRGGYNYVCNYGPRGNWRGKKPYVPGIPCSSCPLGYGCPRGVCAKES